MTMTLGCSPLPDHGGPRHATHGRAAPGTGNRDIPDSVCTTRSRPEAQHGQRITATPATRRMKSAADSTAAGFGIGIANATRARLRRFVLQADANSP